MTTTDITDSEIEAAKDFTDTWLDQLHEAIDEAGCDRAAVAYGLWVDLTQILASFGWTAEELSHDVQHHVALATSDGEMQ